MSLPWETLASVDTPDGKLELRRRGQKDFLITIQGRVLMTSSAHRSEDALAKIACEGLRAKPNLRMLVSGLGMGYTLRAALDELGRDAHVLVAELNPAVIDWCRGPLAELTKDAANDPRVTIHVVDVAKRIANVAKNPERARFDAIVLDMYEGPQTNIRPNNPLYGPAALVRTKRALVPGGVFATWCEGPSVGFERELRAAGFSYRMERAGHGARIHHVYIAHALPEARQEEPEAARPGRPGRPVPAKKVAAPRPFRRGQRPPKHR